MCCNYKDKDLHGQDYGNEKAPVNDIKSSKKKEMDDLLERAKK